MTEETSNLTELSKELIGHKSCQQLQKKIDNKDSNENNYDNDKDNNNKTDNETDNDKDSENKNTSGKVKYRTSKKTHEHLRDTQEQDGWQNRSGKHARLWQKLDHWDDILVVTE